MIQYTDKNGNEHVELIEIKPRNQTTLESARTQGQAIQTAINTAKKAGKFLINNKNKVKKVLTEEGRDIKLELDRECENLIREELKTKNSREIMNRE